MQQYVKILVARISPENRCLGPEHGFLVPAAPDESPPFRLAKDQHYFVEPSSRSANVFGWVDEIHPPITAERLMEIDCANFNGGAGARDRNWYEQYLQAVARQQVDTPMGCHWLTVKGPGKGRRMLRVHKVIFHDIGEQ